MSILKDKFWAFFVHLLISFVVASVCYAVVYHWWYPDGLTVATGVGHLFLMMLGIDVVLGPLLTFLVYKKGKKTLKFDLMTIALVQLLALGYGMYSVHQGRPVWLVYAIDRFELVRANEALLDDGEAMPMFGLYYASVDMDNLSSQEQLDRMFTEAIGNISLAQQPKYHKPYDEVAIGRTKNAQYSLDALNKYNEPKKVQSIITNHPHATGFLPLKATATDMTVLVDKEGHVVEIVDLRPWE